MALQVYISMLRGINVGGHKPVPMNALKKMYENLSFKKVTTYIQSGNVIFQTGAKTCDQLQRVIAKKILETFKMEVPVIVIDLHDLKMTIKENVFYNEKEKSQAKWYVTFLSAEPDPDKLERLTSQQYLPDEWRISRKVIYLFCANGYGTTKLNNNFFENKLKQVATTRNWQTVTELLKIATQAV